MIMTVQPTLEYRRAGSDDEWTRMDPAKREQWQWDDAPDWLAAEALWLMGEGDEVRLVSTGIDTAAHPNLKAEQFGDYTDSACLSLNPPGDNPAVPAGATRYGAPVRLPAEEKALCERYRAEGSPGGDYWEWSASQPVGEDCAGRPNDPGTGAYHHTTDVRRLAETPAPVLVHGYTPDQLKAAWYLVRPSGDWKGPIDAIVAEDADTSAISAACMFFAGTEAVIVRTRGGHRVTGTGYYVNIGS